MKKLICFGVLGFLSSFTNASEWSDKPLPVNYGQPAPMGEPVKVNTAKQNGYAQYTSESKVSIATGYMGSKIGSNDLGGDENFNGFFLNGSYNIDPKLSTWIEYNYQDASEMDFSEVAIGLQYKLLEEGRAYVSTGVGVGYAWLDEDAYEQDLSVNASLKLKYVSLPINFEFGYKAMPKLDVFANIGYKWMFNRDADACINNTCVSTSDSSLNVDGVTYKAGLRYNF